MSGEVAEAAALLRGFAARTGLGSPCPPRRYLWTDAFAVCTDLALWHATGDAAHRTRARLLVDQVHAVLGHHRPRDARSGWISGLDEQEGALHPTRGGLRIGKPLPERGRGEALDERLEWERDGQYFHYLTRWMHALDQLARATGEVRLNTWARELADVAQRAFSAGAGGRGLAWKMSTDLSRPLVASMGQHDPLDGLVTCLQLRATAARLPGAPHEPTLDDAVSGLARLVDPRGLATADPLGLGGLLCDAARVAELWRQDGIAGAQLLDALLAAAAAGLAQFAEHNELEAPAARRLAFRELGLALGLAALDPLAQALEGDAHEAECARLRPRLAALARFAPLGARIRDFWREPAPRRTALWSEHQDIDDVMLAASLVPSGVIALAQAP
ncbi:MAG TPA: hypothetical protein VFY49_14130 [Myxococcota bacterium]|nr:hypothetical protein [Myxococcota bacterium]